MLLRTDPTQFYKLMSLHRVKGIGPVQLRTCYATPGFAQSSLAEIAQRQQLKLGSAELAAATGACEADVAMAEKLNIQILCEWDDEYPPLLKQIPDRPPFLYVRGQLAASNQRAIAVVGTRQPTYAGRIATAQLIEFLVQQGCSIISGLALGCDAIAHQTALAHQGHTLAVLAHGLHTLSPKQNATLAQQILDNGGALVSEYACGVKPSHYQFARRDRLQAGLAHAVVLIQAALNSGSLHAARAAINYQRLLGIQAPDMNDLANHQKSMQANVVICNGSVAEQQKLLKATTLNGIQIIKAVADYQVLLV